MSHRYGKLACHMRSHSVTCHPAEVKILPLPPAEAGTRFSDPGGCKAELIILRESGLAENTVSSKSNALPQRHHATRCNVT